MRKVESFVSNAARAFLLYGMCPCETDVTVCSTLGSVSCNKEEVYKISSSMFRISSYLHRVLEFFTLVKTHKNLGVTHIDENLENTSRVIVSSFILFFKSSRASIFSSSSPT